VLFLIGTGLLAQKSNPKMKEIFNGINLNGWVAPENNIWWTVKDGILTAQSGPERRETILWTEESYEDFIFQTDFKMGEGTVDSGIFLRDENVQVQIGISGSLKRDMTASPYIPGKGYPVEAEKVKEVLNATGWNTLKVEARDNVVTVWVNDQKVMNYTVKKTVDQGPIGLQLHSGNFMIIHFRDIKVTEL
jgi:hypothetical protein